MKSPFKFADGLILAEEKHEFSLSVVNVARNRWIICSWRRSPERHGTGSRVIAALLLIQFLTLAAAL
jgi:hypothetical protein